jgi:hypothetical protein
VFLLTIRLVGISSTQVSWAEVLGIFSLGRLATAVPITPGGVGVVELTYLIWQRNKTWRKPIHPQDPIPVPAPSS